MSQLAFLQTNAFRAYPFVDDEALVDIEEGFSTSLYINELPDCAVLDFGAIMSLNAEYEDDTDYIYLHAIRNVGGLLEFEFRTTASGAANFLLRFLCNPAETAFATYRDVATLINTDDVSLDATCFEGDMTWEGYLIVGELAEVLALVPNDEDEQLFPVGRYRIEPGRVQNLARSFVRSLNLVNMNRTHALPPDGCDSFSTGSTLYVNATCITGHVRLREGYNCAIRQEAAAIVINAARGGGAGLACDEVPLYSGESSPDGGTLLTGGPTCSEIVLTINGVSGPNLQLQAGDGIDVIPHPDLANTLLITAHFNGFALCDVDGSSLGAEA